MVEHHLQRQILTRLTQAKLLRFSQLKPAGLENNAFMYHLRQLMQAGYIAQQEDKSYILTAAGLSYVDGLSAENHRPRRQPKLIAIFVLQNETGQYLLAKRLVQPTIDTWMLPSGKQHFGESPPEHAQRELHDQLGVEVDVGYRGVADIRIWHGEVVVTHLVARLYEGRYGGHAPANTEKFLYEWHAPAEVNELTPGTRELIAALDQDVDHLNLSLDVDAN